ncbi:DUF1553 domain-containing protein, partial [Candidatus Poribacteria bacterium]|nr:DUF1553 domain-containing protein [Candidatus Poribacteria bacterium]
KHGERVLKTPEYEANRKQATEAEKQLATVRDELSRFEPLVYPGRTIGIDDQSDMRVPPDDKSPVRVPSDEPGVTILKGSGGKNGNSGDKGRNERNDPGDLGRLPNLGKGYTWWSEVANTDVFTWDPHASGRFQVWLSWGCGLSGRSPTTQEKHATDAHYLLDLDGDLKTQDDQHLIAKVNQQQFADGTGQAPEKVLGATGSLSLWSGLYDAGVYELNENSRIVLRGGATDAPVTADVIVLQAEGSRNGEISQGDNSVPRVFDLRHSDVVPGPQLRPPVHPRQNVERFSPTQARLVRFTGLKTNGGEPCIDELEIYTAGENSRNVALASGGAKALASSTLPGYDIHKLEHINDGLHGNRHSWISNEPGVGWVQIELPERVVIDRIVWGRDLEGKYKDRLATRYKIEVATEPGAWHLVAGSDDRIPFINADMPNAFYPTAGLSTDETQVLKGLIGELKELDAKLDQLNKDIPKSYTGTFSQPEPTYWLYRGDPFQKREVVTPTDTPEPERRLALARWMGNPKNPLTARVMVNRIWYYHFGEGIVSTPNDLGRNGTRPSHPELLDWLASAFMDSGWSIKAVQRLILLSSTYRQSSQPNLRGLAVDAQCRLLWRFPPRRLEAEAIRDSILSVSGGLSLRRRTERPQADPLDHRATGAEPAQQPVYDATGGAFRRTSPQRSRQRFR